jgi:methyltransferase OMS1
LFSLADIGFFLQEIVTGILFRRSKLLRHATGDVLEIGVGTGRNFTYYEPTQVKHLTAIDASSGMLEVAKKRAEHYGKKQAKGDALDLTHTQFVLQEAEALPFESGKFDTVVDTFGLCSYEDPAKVSCNF